MTTPLISLRKHLLNEIQLLKDRNQQKELQGNLIPLNYPFCVICRGEIKTEAEQVRCSRCKTKFHKKHLTIWLQEEKTCPICRRWISVDYVQ